MLASRTPSAFVCLRCRTKLARPPSCAFTGPALPVLLRSDFSTSQRNAKARRHEYDDFVPLPPGLKYRRGKIVRATSKPLGVKTLGADSEIIVLREIGDAPPGNARRDGERQQSESPPPGGAQQDRALHMEVPEPGLEETIAQIERFRPQPNASADEPVYLTTVEFDKLASQLSIGFTTAQLTRYFSIKAGKKKRREAVVQGLIQGSGESSALVQHTQWHPGIRPLSRRVPSTVLEQAQRSRRPLTKRQLVAEIIRNHWNAVVLEEIEVVGEIDITLKPWQLQLLSSGPSPNPLDRIQQQRGVKLDIYWPQHVLRVTADKSSAEYATEDIKTILSKIEVQRFELGPWAPLLTRKPGDVQQSTGFFAASDLKAIQGITGAILEQQKPTADKDTAIVVRGLDSAQVNDVMRHLISLLPLKRPQSRALLTGKTEKGAKVSYLSPVHEPAARELRHQQPHWGRWAAPIGNANIPSARGEHAEFMTASHEAILSSSFQDTIFDAVVSAGVTPETRPASSSDDQDTNQAVWGPLVETAISSKFGQVLFPFRAEEPFDPLSSDAAETPSIFTSTLPGFHGLLSDYKNDFWGPRWEDIPFDRLQSLTYRFIPSPQNSSRLDSAPVYPHLYVKVMLGQEGTIDIQRVALEHGEHFIDVLVPHWPTDIRFKISRETRLHGFRHDETIQIFEAAIRENITSGGRLNAPPKLNLKIPQFVLEGNGASAEGSDALREVNYVFSGIEHRETVAIQYGEFTLQYSGLQSGQLSGKKEEFELLYGGSAYKGAIISHFINTSLRLGRRISKAWDSAHILRGLRQNRRDVVLRKEQEFMSSKPQGRAPKGQGLYQGGWKRGVENEWRGAVDPANEGQELFRGDGKRGMESESAGIDELLRFSQENHVQRNSAHPGDLADEVMISRQVAQAGDATVSFMPQAEQVGPMIEALTELGTGAVGEQDSQGGDVSKSGSPGVINSEADLHHPITDGVPSEGPEAAAEPKGNEQGTEKGKQRKNDEWGLPSS